MRSDLVVIKRREEEIEADDMVGVCVSVFGYGEGVKRKIPGISESETVEKRRRIRGKKKKERKRQKEI